MTTTKPLFGGAFLLACATGAAATRLVSARRQYRLKRRIRGVQVELAKMERMKKKRTTVVETETIRLTEKDIAEALVAHFGMQGGEVDFDVRMGGYLNGATITRSSTATTEE